MGPAQEIGVRRRGGEKKKTTPNPHGAGSGAAQLMGCHGDVAARKRKRQKIARCRAETCGSPGPAAPCIPGPISVLLSFSFCFPPLILFDFSQSRTAPL